MRNTFAQTLTQLAASDPRVVLLSADIGNRLFDDFKARCPSRFYNCGIAEANMIGMAAGLAMTGLRPVCYTITPFITTRCLEQIRVDLCYHHLPVVIAGVGSGLGYAELGATHHACEDIAVLRALPDMTILCPADPLELKLAIGASLTLDGPCYLRLGKKGEPAVHDIAHPPVFEIGQPITLRQPGMEYADVCILSTGTIAPAVLEAAELLASQGVSPRVESFHTVKPLNHAFLSATFAQHRLIVSVEEHSRVGGLGGALAEWYVDQPSLPRARLLRIATPDQFIHHATHYDAAREYCGLSAQAIAQQMLQAIGLAQSTALMAESGGKA
jgi:transketolase